MGVKREYQYTIEGGNEYEVVGAGVTDQVLGGAGSKGDLLGKLVVSVLTPGSSAVSIKDGSGSSIPLIGTGTALGTYTIWLGIRSQTGAWSVTTGAGSTAVAVGQFTA